MSDTDSISEADGSRPFHTVDPYPLYNGEDVAEYLRSRKASEFPSREAYPPPKGPKDQETKCGCLYTTWHGMSEGDIKLETIWQPLWDTKDVSAGCVRMGFFDGVGDPADGYGYGDRRLGKTNLLTAGHLVWPKKFHVWELELFANVAEPEAPLEDGLVTFIIGEKDHLVVPLSVFLVRGSLRAMNEGVVHCGRLSKERIFLPLPLPLFLPSAQNFRFRIEWEKPIERPVVIRAVMNGYLHREIP